MVKRLVIENSSLTGPTQVQSFTEFRKGSEKFGPFQRALMELLMVFKKPGDSVDEVTLKLDDILKQLRTTIEDFNAYADSKINTFQITIDGDNVNISGLNKTKKDRTVHPHEVQK